MNSPHTRDRALSFAAVLLTGLALVGGLLSSCSACDDPVVVKKVLVDLRPSAIETGLEREFVRHIVEDLVDESGGFDIDDDSQRVLRILIDGYAPGLESATLALTVEVVDNGRTVLRGTALTTLAGNVGPAALLEQALPDALRQILQAHGTDRLDSDELLAILAQPTEGSQRKRRAMLTLASRRDLRATPLVTPYLQEADVSIREAALQALTLLADPTAVDAIIAFSERQPPAIRRQCIDAVKGTDSTLAAAWLFVLSTGHPDPGVQAHARATLALLPRSNRAEPEGPAVATAESSPP
jgi:hypothetical protein